MSPIPSADYADDHKRLDGWWEGLYRLQQWGFSSMSIPTRLASFQVFSFTKTVLTALDQLLAGSWPTFPPAAAPSVNTPLLQKLAERYEALLTVDWTDAQAGIYPHSLLFDQPWTDYLAAYPQFWADLPWASYRAYKKDFHQFAKSIATEGYPKYYLQNFHHQTDGYLSDQSALLYDLQVELLFAGMGDPMRRRILRPLRDHLTLEPTTRILDIACGIGNVLNLLRATFPTVQLYGVDLSPAYLRRANQILSRRPGELPQLIQANAEALPYADHLFEAATCVFLFHELPKSARQAVLNEAARVLKPGGVLVLADSIQLADSPELMDSMKGFSRLFHEPYYRDYIRDDLGERIRQAGLELVNAETHYLSRYWIARKVN